MIGRWTRRAAAVARKRFFWLMRRWGLWPEPQADKRQRLIEEARRNPSLKLTARVTELPTRSSGQADAFSNPTILVLQLAHIGDFVLSLHAAKKLRDGFPGSSITLVCASWNVEWAKGIGFFDRVVAFDFFSRLNQDWKGPSPDLFRRFEALDLGAFDIAVDLRHDADTRPCLYRVNARARAGFMAPLEGGFPPLDLMLPQIERLPLSNGREYSLHAELRLTLLADAVVAAYADGAESHPISLLAASGAPPPRPFCVLAVSAGDSIRRWSPAKFAELAQRLIDELGLDVCVVGGWSERPIVEAILSELPQGRAFACVDLPLIELAARVGQASLLVGLGSGVTHLAATLGVPTVSILSGVSPLAVWRPVGPRVVNLTGETPCSPCGLKHEKDCPFDVVCLRSITAEHVLTAADRLLQASDRARRDPEGLADRGRAMALHVQRDR